VRKVSLAIVGVGNLGSRLVELFNDNTALIKKIYVVSQSGERAEDLAKLFPLRVTALKKGTPAPESLDFIFLCCKPKDFASGVESAHALVDPKAQTKPALCSMLAGVSLKLLEKAFPGNSDILRAMPNLAITYRRSVTGFICSKNIRQDAKELFDALLARGGFTLELNSEEAIDAVTAMASSGLAYFAKMAESLALTAKAHGFSESEALSLATQTLIGAGIVAENTELSEIRRQVATKGGTTEKALEVFEKKKLDKIVSAAVEAAMKRARELAK